jgi:hypothetical protein
MAYSLQQAATATGTAKSTILRAIRKGKVSAERDEHGQWVIQPAELHRTYPPSVASKDEGNGARNDTHLGQLVEAKGRAELAEREVTLLRAMVEDLKVQRDAWQTQAERLLLAPPAPKPDTKPMTWWRWLRTSA